MCRGVEQGAGRLANSFVYPTERRYDIAPEAHRIVVVSIQGEPYDRPFGAPGPVGKQCCLAEPGRGADQDKAAASRPLQAAGQAGRGRRSGRMRGMLNLAANKTSRLPGPVES